MNGADYLLVPRQVPMESEVAAGDRWSVVGGRSQNASIARRGVASGFVLCILYAVLGSYVVGYLDYLQTLSLRYNR